ncbi:MAG: hypothetical protein QM778_10650 [Myxococcales bacterium]
MRVSLLALALTACGPVLLGQESAQDGGGQGPDSPQVSLTVASVGCHGCFELHAAGVGGGEPYTFEWDDGSDAEVRQVCPGDGSNTVSVVAIDAHHRRSAAAIAELEFGDASCPPPPQLLCIQNPSFEGKPAFNDTNAANFDGAPWNNCPQPSLNTPDIVNETIQQPIATLPTATDGLTYIGIQEGEQVSQTLCEPLAGGEELYLKLDARRLYIGAMPDTELPWLEIWGGLAASCDQQKLLWASEKLPLNWQTYCAKLKPQQYMDQITLRTNTDESLPSVTYLLVDNLVPVEHCP